MHNIPSTETLDRKGKTILSYWPNRISYKRIILLEDTIYSITYRGTNGTDGMLGGCDTCYPYDIIVKIHGHNKYIQNRLPVSALNRLQESGYIQWQTQD